MIHQATLNQRGVDSIPIFTGTKRSGAEWDAFCEATPGAADCKGYLLQTEVDLITSAAAACTQAINSYAQNLVTAGWTVLAWLPERDFFTTYDKVCMGVNPDGIFLLQGTDHQGGTVLHWHIVELKTSSKELEDTMGLAWGVKDLGYALQAVLYTKIIGDIFSTPDGWVQMGVDISHVNPAQVAATQGTFSHLWFHKETGFTNWDTGFTQYPLPTNAGDCTWTTFGATQVAQALFNLNVEMYELGQFVHASPGGDMEALKKHKPPTLFKKVPVPGSLKYAQSEMLQGLGEVGEQTVASMAEARAFLATKFKEPPKPPQFTLVFGGKATAEKEEEEEEETVLPVPESAAPPPLPTDEKKKKKPTRKRKAKGRGSKKVAGVFLIGDIDAPREALGVPTNRFGFAEHVDSRDKEHFTEHEAAFAALGVELNLSDNIRTIRSSVKRQLKEAHQLYFRGEDNE